MDGNCSLVHRRAAGMSFREPMFKNMYFLPQDDVDAFISTHRVKSSTAKVWIEMILKLLQLPHVCG